MAGGGLWEQRFTVKSVRQGEGVVIDINSADDAAYVSLNNKIVGGVGNDGSHRINENVAASLHRGHNVMVVSLYNDNRKGYTDKEDSPTGMDGTLSIGSEMFNLDYAKETCRPGLVYQHVFLIRVVA